MNETTINETAVPFENGRQGAVEKRIVIDVSPYRTRVVLLENGHAAEVYSEQHNRESLVGNIFRGRVRSILPGMAAAFVDIGEEKNAFFSMSDLRPQVAAEAGIENAKPPKLKVGQELMVQIIKDPYGTKGARVSSQISISGHLLVLFPTEDTIGISKNITDEAERERLKAIVSAAKDDGVGVIVRTAAEGRYEADLIAELRELSAKWKNISTAYRGAIAPKRIYREYGLVERTVRDLFRPDVASITVNDRECFDTLRTVVDEVEPGSAERVHLEDNEPNLFEVLGIEKQIDEALSRRVWLKSGAYIVIDRTEALISIDVNSGKNIGKTDLQQTALATNCEAAEEIARQLRLRDIGGIIIIDFIDLENKNDRQTVVRTLREAMRFDRTTTVVHGMTALGLVEVTRKKLRENLPSSLQADCPCCEGSGKVLSYESVALKIRARILSRILKEGPKRVSITADPNVIRLIRKHLSEECRRYSLKESDFVLNERLSVKTDEFELHYLND
ncbi:MAG: Rne/Rng family ribonuclease [Clostridia bacterium]|nr:Rne/Rng family ribonuclease [Clostridia bacterium]